MKNILILCTGNSCRSQIAHGYLEQLLKDKAAVYSAGIETHGVNPNAIDTMLRDGIDISKHTSNDVNEYLNIDFDYIITVCDNAKEQCPVFPNKATRFHCSFPDPAKATGSAVEIAHAFDTVRDLIKEYCYVWTKEHF